MADETKDKKDKDEYVKPESPKRYIVEAHTTFEINGSTVTFRPNQVLTTDWDIDLAKRFNVPLRELVPIK